MNADDDQRWMKRALSLAWQGEGCVEPNPMVGCVIVQDNEILGEGWHRRFGGPHAEREALSQVADPTKLAGATWYITMEPCCHHGKTPPCTDAVLQAKPARVVIAHQDPFAQVAGKGLELLRKAGIETVVGIGHDEAVRLNAPYLMRLQQQRPWVIGKWAMTLDGKIASRTGHSQWISGEKSRQKVHQLRGRVDAIVVGIGTALADDPLLTARPAGPRVATRLILDRAARLPLTSQLVRTAQDVPLLVVCDHSATPDRVHALQHAGAEILRIEATSSVLQTQSLLQELGRREMTNVLVEGGAGVLASFFEADALDEIQAFIAPKLLGGENAASPLGGLGLDRIDDSPRFEPLGVESLAGDLLVTTRRIKVIS